jgi:hypothetical protein
MKTVKFLAFSIFALLIAPVINAQTADEIVAKYIDAVGGKDNISKVTSLVTESTLDVMGSQGTLKETVLVGKGAKTEIDVMGTQVVMCVTDTAGWSINPMTGNYNAEPMPKQQYDASKDQLWLLGAFQDYVAKGFKLELAGQQTVNNVNANKILVTSPEGVVTEYYFDPETNLLIQAIVNSEMGGQTMQITNTFSDYRKADNGITIPYKMEQNYGGQFFLVSTVTKADFNVDVDPAIFVAPK